MSKFIDANKKIEEKAVGTYKAVEDGVVGAYKKIENTVVGAYKKVEDKCIENLFAKDGETVEEAKARLSAAKNQQSK